MRIAQIAPLIEPVPPKKYGGTERVIHALTEELVRRGHDVTLFASGDSVTSAKLVSVYPRSLRSVHARDMYGLNEWGLINFGVAYAQQDEFDVIHDHVGILSLPTAEQSRTPVVHTNHGPFTPYNRNIYRLLRRPHVVTISEAQRRALPEANHIATIYNGLPMEDHPFSADHDGYLVFVGRISEEKGVHHAVEVAEYLNLPLIMAAKVDEMTYFRNYIEPHLSDQIRWIGEINQEQRNQLMSRAMAFLHPVTWREPFGLTLIEAMACGCPVVAFDKGSIPEIIRHGQTGFVVREIEDMLDAVQRIDTIDRATCRRHALENFNARRMADGYERIYRALVNTAA